MRLRRNLDDSHLLSSSSEAIAESNVWVNYLYFSSCRIDVIELDWERLPTKKKRFPHDPRWDRVSSVRADWITEAEPAFSTMPLVYPVFCASKSSLRARAYPRYPSWPAQVNFMTSGFLLDWNPPEDHWNCLSLFTRFDPQAECLPERVPLNSSKPLLKLAFNSKQNRTFLLPARPISLIALTDGLLYIMCSIH